MKMELSLSDLGIGPVKRRNLVVSLPLTALPLLEDVKLDLLWLRTPMEMGIS